MWALLHGGLGGWLMVGLRRRLQAGEVRQDSNSDPGELLSPMAQLHATWRSGTSLNMDGGIAHSL